ncbi:MAG: c-type cytochrome [Acidobacteriota bacterium]
MTATTRMKKNITLIATLICVGISDLGMGQGAVPQRNSEAIYLKNCAMCHGSSGKGDGGAVPDFTSRRWRQTANLQRLAVIISRGTGPMPSFGELLDHEEIDAVSRYLLTLADREERRRSGGSEALRRRVTVTRDQTAPGSPWMVYLELDGESESRKKSIQLNEALYLHVEGRPERSAVAGVAAYRLVLSQDPAGRKPQQFLDSPVELRASDYSDPDQDGDKVYFRRAVIGPYSVEVRMLRFEIQDSTFAELDLVVRIAEVSNPPTK